jgi:hypothetical protein
MTEPYKGQIRIRVQKPHGEYQEGILWHGGFWFHGTPRGSVIFEQFDGEEWVELKPEELP